MKVKVVKSFIDKHTQQVREVNETFTCDEKRFKEIESVGHFVEKVAEDKADSKPEKATKKKATE